MKAMQSAALGEMYANASSVRISICRDKNNDPILCVFSPHPPSLTQTSGDMQEGYWLHQPTALGQGSVFLFPSPAHPWVGRGYKGTP